MPMCVTAFVARLLPLAAVGFGMLVGRPCALNDIFRRMLSVHAEFRSGSRPFGLQFMLWHIVLARLVSASAFFVAVEKEVSIHQFC